MMDELYEFDLDSLDDTDIDDGYSIVSLDDWEPEKKTKTVPKSQWRSDYKDADPCQRPGLDEIRKINFYIKNKYPDHQIMDSFGISAEILVAIKSRNYCPVDGISLDNLSKIQKEFEKIDKKIELIYKALQFFADNGFNEADSFKRSAFKGIISRSKKKNKRKNKGDEEE